MNTIKQYNAARTEIESCFKGLPSAPSHLVGLLSTRANPITGIVENVTYRDLAILLTIFSAPGRKNSGIPNKQAIRSFLRTIETQCGEHFKIISDDQSLKIKFLTMPTIYACHFEREELNTPMIIGQYTREILINTDQNASNDDELSIEEYTDLYPPEGEQAINACKHAYAKIKPNFKPNNNKKQIVSELTGEIKNPIPDNFEPSQAMIDNALGLGLSKVSDPSELNKFIIFNKSTGSRWANWDYVYLNWLIRDVEREEAKKTAEQKQPKSAYSRRDSNEHNPRQTPTERVIAAFSEGNHLEFCQNTRRFKRREAPAHNPAPVRYLDCHDLGPIN